MTLDETIEKYREKGNPYGTCCEECEKEHEQLVEWLEELKELRNITAGHLYAVAFNRGYLKAEKEERNRAIDDLA